MTVFITGGAGFIGSNFIHYLVSKGWQDLVVIDKLSYAANLNNLYPLDVTFKQVDIKRLEKLEDLFIEFKPQFVFNFAAESHVDNSIKDVYPFIESNIIGTVNLLSLSLKYEVERFHHISTDEVYGSLNAFESSFKEIQYPRNPYSASKAASDHFVMAFHNTFGLNTVITNCSNNYGPRQHYEKLIPKTILNVMQNKKVPIYGKGANIRDWLYVEDHFKAIFDVFNRGKIGHKYNVGGNCEISNIELVRLIINLMNSNEGLIEYVEDRPGHDFRYSINNEKINLEIGWEPSYNMKTGLIKTINWYESVKD